MASKFLGPFFEIHRGGLDLVVPHHENARAQSQAAGREFARLWMHNGMLEFVGEKMSKSVGNVASLHDVLERWERETVLVYFLTGHWSKPIDFSDDVMQQARTQWLAFQGAFRVPKAEPPPGEWGRLVEALEDDFNTPHALAVLHEWRTHGYWYLLDQGLAVFGLSLPPMAGTGVEAERLRRERDEARTRKDWRRADELREAIRGHGLDVIDEPDGSRLVPK